MNPYIAASLPNSGGEGSGAVGGGVTGRMVDGVANSGGRRHLLQLNNLGGTPPLVGPVVLALQLNNFGSNASAGAAANAAADKVAELGGGNATVAVLGGAPTISGTSVQPQLIIFAQLAHNNAAPIVDLRTTYEAAATGAVTAAGALVASIDSRQDGIMETMQMAVGVGSTGGVMTPPGAGVTTPPGVATSPPTAGNVSAAAGTHAAFARAAVLLVAAALTVEAMVANAGWGA